jgi:hypothetical protein
MTTMNFSVATCKTLKFKDAIEYIEKYFIPLDDGNHAVLVNGKWEIKTEDLINRVYFKRLSLLLQNYYFVEYDRILTPISDKTKPLFYDNFINFEYKPITLRTHFWFLVDEFISKTQGLNIKPKDLHKLYETYYNNHKENNERFDGEPMLTKKQMIEELKLVGIKTTKSGLMFYKYAHDELFNIGAINEWYFITNEQKEINALKAELEMLKSQFEEYKVEKEDEIEALKHTVKSFEEKDEVDDLLDSASSVDSEGDYIRDEEIDIPHESQTDVKIDDDLVDDYDDIEGDDLVMQLL